MPGDGRDVLHLCLVDDHEVVLRGLQDFLQDREDLVVTAAASTGADALAAVEEWQPDVVVLDLRLPDMDGFELCREIRSRFPEVSCLVVSSHADEDDMIDAIVAGAAGYVLKEAPLADVVEAIRAVGSGRTLLDPALTERVLARLRENSADRRLASLTPPERKILSLLSSGATNREIADELYLAEQTVKNYVSSVLAKLGMDSRTQAAVYAVSLEKGEERDNSQS